jgi:hypothetical protein
MKGVAPSQPAKPQKASAEDAVELDRLDRVLRTAGQETAIATQASTQEALVDND